MTTTPATRPSDWDRLVEGESILARRNEGAKVSELCSEFGYTPETLAPRVREAAQQRASVETDVQRELQNALLDDLTGRWGQQVAMAEEMARVGSLTHDMKMMMQGMALRESALRNVLSVAERRARLNGLDAPIKTESKITHETETDRAIDDLTRMMDEMVADAPPSA